VRKNIKVGTTGLGLWKVENLWPEALTSSKFSDIVFSLRYTKHIRKKTNLKLLLKKLWKSHHVLQLPREDLTETQVLPPISFVTLTIFLFFLFLIGKLNNILFSMLLLYY
jgi:hypothetical protein